MPRLLLIILLAYPLLLSAQVYKHIDADGNVSFTDQPPPNSEKIDIPVSNSAQPPPVISRPAAEPAATPGDYSVTIMSPEPEAVIPRGPGNFSVSASVTPAPDTSMQLQLVIDGDPWGAPQNQPQWNLTNIPRGTHELQVAVIDSKGKRLTQSDPVTVYVFRPSVNF